MFSLSTPGKLFPHLRQPLFTSSSQVNISRLRRKWNLLLLISYILSMVLRFPLLESINFFRILLSPTPGDLIPKIRGSITNNRPHVASLLFYCCATNLPLFSLPSSWVYWIISMLMNKKPVRLSREGTKYNFINERGQRRRKSLNNILGTRTLNWIQKKRRKL